MVGGFLCCAGGDHQQLGIVVEFGQPALDVASMIVATLLGWQAEHVACQRSGDLGHQFLGGVRIVTEATRHVTSKAILVSSPVRQLM